MELIRPGPCARARGGATESEAKSINAARAGANIFFMRTPSNISGRLLWPVTKPGKYRQLRLYVNLKTDRTTVRALQFLPTADAEVRLTGDLAGAALDVVRVGLGGRGRPRRAYKQLLCRSECILMRRRAGEFAPLEPAFRRKKYEGEDGRAQHVVLPRRPSVRPENDFFEDVQQHKK